MARPLPSRNEHPVQVEVLAARLRQRLAVGSAAAHGRQVGVPVERARAVGGRGIERAVGHRRQAARQGQRRRTEDREGAGAGNGHDTAAIGTSFGHDSIGALALGPVNQRWRTTRRACGHRCRRRPTVGAGASRLSERHDKSTMACHPTSPIAWIPSIASSPRKTAKTFADQTPSGACRNWSTRPRPVSSAPPRARDSCGTRPMGVQNVDDDGNLWFLSANDSHKNGELARDPSVKLYFQGSRPFRLPAPRRPRDRLTRQGEDQGTVGADPQDLVHRGPRRSPHHRDQVRRRRLLLGHEARQRRRRRSRCSIGAAIGKTLDDSIEGRVAP